MRKKILLKILFLLLPFIYVQGQLANDSIVVANEKHYDQLIKKIPFYVESLFDTLCFNGEKYFFRHTPLVIKKGYTNIIPEMFNFRPIFGTTAHKGYRFLWCIRNDSLYIADIHPAFQGYHKDYQMKEIIDFVPRDTIISRLEAFSGSNFREGLLFIDWINGDFPVVKANPDPPETKKSLSWKLYDTDYLYPPLIFSFKNGLIVGIKEDKKGIKDLKKIDRKNNH